MWRKENRARYDRSGLRYPSDLTDEEWALIGLHIRPARRGGNKRTVKLREVVNGLMYILSTGCQWRAIPKDLPPRSTLYDYFDLWSWDGTGRSIGFITPSMSNAAKEPGARRLRQPPSSTARA
jgi:transposase